MQNPQEKKKGEKDAHYSRAPVRRENPGPEEETRFRHDRRGGEIPGGQTGDGSHPSPRHVQERHVRGWGSALGQKKLMGHR